MKNKKKTRSGTKRLRPPVQRDIISSLPAEILQEIFYHYVYTPGKPWSGKKCEKRWRSQLTGSFRRVQVWSDGASYPLTTPMHLAHVCSMWREITFSTSVLWNQLLLRDLEPHDLPLCEFWIERSHLALLDISMEWAWPDDSAIAAVYSTIMQTVIQASHRLRRVSLGVEIVALSHFWRLQNQQTTVLETPFLQDLKLKIENYPIFSSGVEAEPLRFGKLFTRSPALRKLTLDTGIVDWVPWKIFFEPWGSITELTLVGHCSICHCELGVTLQTLPNLEVLMMDAVSGFCPAYLGLNDDRDCAEYRSSFPQPPPCVLPRLQTLHLTGEFRPFLPEIPILDGNISTPALSTLSIIIGLWSDDSRAALEAWKALDKFVERSGCRIYNFAWGECSVEAYSPRERRYVYGYEERDLQICDGVLDYLKRASKTSLQFLRTLDLRSRVSMTTALDIIMDSEFKDLRVLKAFVPAQSWKSYQKGHPCVGGGCNDMLTYRETPNHQWPLREDASLVEFLKHR